MKNKTCYAVIADTHCGHDLGLINPGVKLWREGKSGLYEYSPKLSEFSKYLWHDVYIPGVKKILKFSTEIPLVLLHLSDVIQGDRYDSTVVRENQVIIAESIFDPWYMLKNLKAIKVVGGTDAHDFAYAPTISMVRSMNSKKVPVSAVLHGLIQRPDGFEIDYTHHGPHQGIRSHTRGRVAAYALRDLINFELKHRGRCANLYLRAHRHNLLDVKDHDGDHMHWSRLIISPSLSGMNAYARKVTQSTHYIKNGLYAFIVDDGQVVDECWNVETLDLRTVEDA